MEPLRPSRVPTDVRMDAARLQGTVQRWTSTDELRDRPIEEAAEALRQVTTDPIALGVALGRARAFAELDGHDAYRKGGGHAPRGRRRRRHRRSHAGVAQDQEAESWRLPGVGAGG